MLILIHRLLSKLTGILLFIIRKNLIQRRGNIKVGACYSHGALYGLHSYTGQVYQRLLAGKHLSEPLDGLPQFTFAEFDGHNAFLLSFFELVSCSSYNDKKQEVFS